MLLEVNYWINFLVREQNLQSSLENYYHNLLGKKYLCMCFQLPAPGY